MVIATHCVVEQIKQMGLSHLDAEVVVWFSSAYKGSLSGFEPIRFLLANICIFIGKKSCNIRILLRFLALSILNICSI